MADEEKDDVVEEDELEEEAGDEASDDEAEDDADEDDADVDEDEADEDEADEDDADEDDADEDAEEGDGEDASDFDENYDTSDFYTDDGRAADIARSLGVGEEEEEEEEEKEAPLNRAERRRRRAARRRKARGKGGELAKDAPVQDDELVPRDRNARRRQRLLERRKRAAEAEEDIQPDRLLPSEMVDDALARGSDRAIKWLINNWKWLQWALVGSVVVGGGLLTYKYYSDEAASGSSQSLGDAISAEEATVIPKDKDDRTDEQKLNDPRVIFASDAEKNQAALDSYTKVAGTSGGAAILAKLGAAGVLLDKAEWDGAIAAFDAVLGTPLAGADVDVKGRALEGKGFALEAKGDNDAALAVFESMAELTSDNFKTVSLYHQARIIEVKGEKDKAIEKLKEAKKAVEKAKLDTALVTSQHPYRWIEKAIEDELGRLDPSALPPKAPGGGGIDALPEHIKQKLREQGLQPGIPPQQ